MTGFLPVMMIANYVAGQLTQKWERQLNDHSAAIQGRVSEVF